MRRLVLLVAVEAAKGAASAWAPYLAALPESYTDPLWWDDELLQVRSPSSRQAHVHVRLTHQP